MLTKAQGRYLAQLAQAQIKTGKFALASDARALWGLAQSRTSTLLRTLQRKGYLTQHSDDKGNASLWEVKNLAPRRKVKAGDLSLDRARAPRVLVIRALKSAEAIMTDIPTGRLLMRAAGDRALGTISDQDLAEALNTLANRYRSAS